MSFTQPIVFRVASEAVQLAKDVDRIARNFDKRIRELVAVKILTGVHLADQAVTASATTIYHGLGRTPIGCIVVKSDSTASYKTDTFNNETIDITASTGTPTVSLWVY